MKSLRALLTVSVLFLLQNVLSISAQTKPSNSPADSKQVVTAQRGEENLVNLELVPSQRQWIIGTRMGLLGKITNISTVPLVFLQSETGFISPAETRIYDKTDFPIGCVLFSTEKQATSPSGGSPLKATAVTLQSHESYWVFWDYDKGRCSGQISASDSRSRWEALAQKIMFQPGTYKFVLQAKFYEAPGAGEGNADVAHFASQDLDVNVTASEGMILLAAILGGFLGFLVKLLTPSTEPDPKGTRSGGGQPLRWEGWWKITLHALGACTLGITVVILGSRLAATQFPFQVSVSDFWGALTIGFFGYFGGFALIQRIAGGVTKNP